jgi:translation initiation factor 2 alpha subunit (eIF-2alpha)
MNLREDDLVLCTVKRIEKTIVFLEIDGDGQGSMALSEVSPGRIRNIREFVSINKKVVCKILRIKDDQIELSLRRVSAKERDLVLDKYKKEKTIRAMLEQALKEKTDSVLDKIKEHYDLAEFLDLTRENPKIIEKFVSKSEAEALSKIFIEKKEKEKEIKKKILVRTQEPSGLESIKTVLSTKDADIRYLGSSAFSVNVKGKDFKLANTKMEAILKEMKEKAKQLKVEFEVK